MGKLAIAALTGWLLLQSATTSRLAVPGGEIAYDVAGSGEAVVFLHGAFMDRGSWDAQVPVFAKQYRVVRYDIRPFGESKLEQPYTVHEDLRRLLEHLKIARAHLVGHSFGGGVVLDFALAYPDRVATLTLAGAGPMGFVSPEDERQAAGAVFAAVKQGDDAIIAAWLKHPMWAASQQRPDVLRALDTSTRKSLSAFRLQAPPFVPTKPAAIERLGEIKAPTLVIVGDKDTPGNRQASDLLGKQIPNAQLKVIAGADHALPLGWSAEFNSAVLAFLSTARR
jgi:pimeloyl-ACP methyl ester carboxylesterase